MKPADPRSGEDQALPIDGLVVEEIDDEDTIRTFVRAWRQRVSREYARSLLEGSAVRSERRRTEAMHS